MTTFRKFWETKPRTDYFEYFNDFLSAQEYAAADWTVTETGVATQAIGNLVGGVLVVTNAAADNDASWQQLNVETFKYAADKALEFEFRFKISDITNTDFAAGLAITDTTPMAVSDGIFFRSAEDSTDLLLVVVKDSAESVLTLTDQLADDTWVKIGFYHSENGDTVDAFVNDVRVGALPLTNAPDDEELTVSFGFANGEAIANVLSVDYVRAVQQR